MILSASLLIVGLALLVIGAEGLVRGASNLARSVGVSELSIGLTIVAFGTSTPELAVNLTAAIEGTNEVGFGNVVGSNIANLGLILGASALIRPLAVHALVIRREIPMMVLAAAVVVALSMDRPLTGIVSRLDRGDAIALLLLFCVFLYYSIWDVLGQRGSGGSGSATNPVELRRAPAAIADATLVIVGLAALFIGGRLTVTSAVDLARMAGLPEVFIALTLVAVGTSLPELATSLVAAWRGQTDIAIGNVVGSNIFNILFILGVSTSISPVVTPIGGGFDLAAMLLLSVILLPFAMTDRERLVRWEGAAMLSLYFGYVAWRYIAIR